MKKQSRKEPKRSADRKVSPHPSHNPPEVSGHSFAWSSSFKKARLFYSAILIAAILFIYAQVRSFEFTGWDDPLYVTQNEHVLKGMSWEGFRWALGSGHAANWHPLTWISHMVDVQIFGAAPGPIHCINVLFHIGNALILFWLLLRMTSALGRSAFVAALFAVHPLHVESVAWIAERKDVLSTFLLLLTLLAYTSYVRRRDLRSYLLVSISFLMALMAKPMTVTLPLLLILLDIWPLERIRWREKNRELWRRLAIEKLPLFALAAIVSLVTLIVQHRGGTVAGLEAFPLGLRVQNAVVSYAAYLFSTFWPVDLSPFYPYHPLSILAVAASSLALIAISALAVRASARYSFILTGWFWYLISLAPVIGLIQTGDQARADRYTYIPLIGIFMILAWGVPILLPQRKYWRWAIAVAAGIIVCLLSTTARIQAGYWKDAFTLWQHALNSTAENAHAHVNLGFALMDRGKTENAIAQYNEAIRIRPEFAEAHNALGAALLAQNRIAEAGAHFNQALSLKPAYIEAMVNMGSVLARQGRKQEAISYFTQALTSKRDDPKIHYNLALALAEMGRETEAAAHYSECIQIKPNFAEPYAQLGNLLMKQGQPQRAIEQYQTAIRIKPNYVEARTNLGIALISQGRVAEASSDCSEALRIDPAFAAARVCLGDGLAQSGRQNDAMVEYRRALEINPHYAEAYHLLAKLLINAMRDAEAIPYLEKALSLRPDFAEARIDLAIALINKGRESEAIHHLNKLLMDQPDNQSAKTTLKVALQRKRKN